MLNLMRQVDLSLGTGNSLEAKAGDVTLSAGTSHSSVGASVSISAGDTNEMNSVGGAVSVTGGQGEMIGGSSPIFFWFFYF